MPAPGLADIAREVAREVQDFGPRNNVDGLARLMVLVARDVAQVNNTGRTFEHIEADAVTVARWILDGGRL
jgi:hypothetical protein